MPSLLDVWLFEAKTFLLVNNLQDKSEQEGCYAEASQHDERSCVVELGRVGHSGVSGAEHLADEQREEPQT